MRGALAAILAIVVAWAAWLALHDGSRPIDPIATIDRGRLEPVELPVVIAEPEPAVARSVLAPAAEIASAPTSAESEGTDALPDADAAWIEGRVEFPPGTPKDERAFVSMVVPPISDAYHTTPPERFPVGADGRFRGSIARTGWTVELDVVGRYVLTRAPWIVDLNRPLPEIVLRPTLGACVRVRVVPSATLVSRGYGLAGVAVARRSIPFDFSELMLHLRDETTDAAGIAEVGSLDTERSWGVGARRFGALTTIETLPIAPALVPGEVREVVLPIEAAPRFRGHVRDERGDPIEGAWIELTDGARGFGLVSAISGEDGSFVAHPDFVGTTRMRVTKRGHADRDLGPWETSPATDVDDLDVVLAGGAPISGVVRWPDGAPASGAWMSLQRTGNDPPQPERVEVASDGTFRTTGVEGRPCTLYAGGRVRIDPQEGKWRYVLLAARAEVSAPATDLVLVLSTGSVLRGRVVDDLGNPVGGVPVSARPELQPSEDERRDPVVTEADGSFALQRIRDGNWTLFADAPGHAFPDDVPIAMPADASRTVELVVARGAVITGRVVDAHGEPVASADVELEAADERNASRKYFPSTKSAPDGAFRIARVPGGTLRVRARILGHAPSLGVAVTTAPGETTSDVELALRTGGTIDGRMLDASGAALPSEEVWLWRSGVTSPIGRVLTDANGQFAFEHVEEGEVYVWPKSRRGGPQIESVTVTIEDGAASRVVMRP